MSDELKLHSQKTAFQAMYDALGYSAGGTFYGGILYIKRENLPESVKEIRIADERTYNLALNKSAHCYDRNFRRIPNPIDDGVAP